MTLTPGNQVVSHPHPKLGGDFDNNVVMALSHALNAMGVATVRFNTRGVGTSRGSSSWFGVAEREDAKAAVAFAWTLPGVTKLLLCAYSFGAAVGASAVFAKPPSAIALVGYPRGFWAWFLFSSHYAALDTVGLGRVPKLLVLGEHDNFTSVATLEAMFATMDEPKRMEIIPGADHFFFGREHLVAAVLVDWLRPLL